MSFTQRSILISNLLRENGATTVKTLAERLNVSEMTVRRDLQSLCRTHALKLMNGVVFPDDSAQGGAVSYDIAKQQTVRNREKELIGRRAAALIEPRDTVFVDCGSTAAAMARYIPFRMDITVVCSTLNILLEVQKKDVANIVFSGGFYHKGTQVFESPETIRMLEGVRAGKAFVTAAGASRELGLTCVQQYEVALKQLELNNSLERILLADSSKFGKVSLAYFGAWHQITCVVTDAGISQDWQSFLKDAGIRVLIAQ